MAYRNPVLTWLNEDSPQSTPRTEPPPWNADMWQITRSEVIIRKDQAPLVHIWYAAIPAVPR